MIFVAVDAMLAVGFRSMTVRPAEIWIADLIKIKKNEDETI